MSSANSYYYKVVREGNFALSLFHFANLYFTLRRGREPSETTEKVVEIRFQENTRFEKGNYLHKYLINCEK